MSKKKKFGPVTYTYEDGKGLKETMKIPEQYHKYVERLVNNTQNNKKSSQQIKKFLNEYALIYHAAMNFFVPLMDEIANKLIALQEKRVEGQTVQEFSMELIMLNQELESHYSMMEPLYDLYKMIKQKDTEIFKKAYDNCSDRVDHILGEFIKVFEEHEKK